MKKTVLIIVNIVMMLSVFAFIAVSKNNAEERLQHKIPFAEAQDMINHYQMSEQSFDQLDGEWFRAEEVKLLLQQKGCAKLYLARAKHNGDEKEVINILFGMTAENVLLTDLVLEKSMGCPPNCGVTMAHLEGDR